MSQVSNGIYCFDGVLSAS